ncbi:MAG: FAD-binding oxidoreductase [Acidobacteriota bacterium]
MAEFDTRTLSEAIACPVLTRGDRGYDDARRIFNTRFDRHPDAVVQCRSAAEVGVAVDFARANDLLLSVKGGGHSYAANTVADGGLLIDLSAMNDVEVDPERKRVRVGAGARWGVVDAATQQHGLATVGGTVSTVGVAGFTLGGGSGYLSRKYGMAVDNLLAAEVVTAAGERVRASADEHPDLFWALRGGSGNFGVVTAFELALHEVGPEVLAGQIAYRFEDAAKVLKVYREFMNEAPEEVQCYPFILHVPPIPEFPAEFHGQIAIDLVVFHADPSREDELRPLLELGSPILSYIATQPYLGVQKMFDEALPSGQRWESRAQGFTELTDEAIDTCLAHIEPLPGEFTSAYFAAENGAISRIDCGSTAYPHRDLAFSLHILAGWSDPAADDEVTAWTRRCHGAMSPFSTDGVYVNLLGTDEKSRVRAAYGDNYERLVEVKRTWDPQNLFRMNHNIEP